MNKEEFLNKLRKKLDILEDKEIEDIISEYEGYIEEKVSRGLTEEEAVKELDDLNEIVNDLLAAYKIKQKDTNYIKKFINKISQGLDYILNELSNKSGKDILKFVIEIALIILIICIFKIPFLIVKDLGWNIFTSLSSPISDIFYGIWSFIIELSYFIIAIVLFIKIIEKRYFKNFSEKIVSEIDEEKEGKKEEKVKIKNEKKTEVGKETKEKSPKKLGIVEIITNICILFIKFIVVMILIGVIFYLVGMMFALGLGIYLLIKGVPYFGIFILLLALVLSGVLLLQLGIYFVFNKKIKASHTLIEVIIIVVLSGFGLALSTVEIAETEIIYDSMIEETKTISEEISVDDNLVLYGKYNVIIDESLTDAIRVEYVYPDMNDIKVEIDLEHYNNGYYLDYTVSNLKWNKEIWNKVIDNLKDKKIYVDNFEIEKNVYMSTLTKEKLESNKSAQNNPSILYEFTQTYHVVNIEESNDYNYLYLTVRQFQFEEIATVKVLRSLASAVEEDKNYEFTFQYEYPKVELTEGTIEELFEKCHLISIEYTDEIGLGQTQESPVPEN